MGSKRMVPGPADLADKWGHVDVSKHTTKDVQPW